MSNEKKDSFCVGCVATWTGLIGLCVWAATQNLAWGLAAFLTVSLFALALLGIEEKLIKLIKLKNN